MSLKDSWNHSSKELLNEAEAAEKAFWVCQTIVDHWDGREVASLWLDEIAHLARIALAEREESRKL